MGKPRGQRNAAREKVWPGERADSIREAKRDYERFSSNGETNWKILEEEADKLLPDLPRIEWKENIQPQLAVNIGNTRKFRAPDDFQLRRLEKKLAVIDEALEEAQDKVVTTYADFSRRKQIDELKPIGEITPIKHPVNTCDRCGGPRGGVKPLTQKELSDFGLTTNPFPETKHYCRLCFRLNAIDRRNRLLAELPIKTRKAYDKCVWTKTDLLKKKEEIFQKYYETSDLRDEAVARLNEEISAYNYWVEQFAMCEPKKMAEFDGDFWISPVAEAKMKQGTVQTLMTRVPDIAEDLIEAIEAEEIAQGKPFVHCIAPENRPPKPLYKSATNVALMFNQRKRQSPIRQQRPKWKTLRGQWA